MFQQSSKPTSKAVRQLMKACLINDLQLVTDVINNNRPTSDWINEQVLTRRCRCSITHEMIVRERR